MKSCIFASKTKNGRNSESHQARLNGRVVTDEDKVNKMEKSGPLTMKDIAREFDISVATVSRALKDSPRISEERRKAIQTYAREHNFYPNAIGEALRHSRVMPQRLIGVIVPEFTHYYFMSVLTGIEEAAAARGYRIMVALSGEQYEREARICDTFHRYKVCGVIVSQAKDTRNYDHYQKLIDAGIPMVFYDRICTGVNASRVVVDDYMGASPAYRPRDTITRILCTSGTKKPAPWASGISGK